MRYTNRSTFATNTREPNGQQIGSVPNKIRDKGIDLPDEFPIREEVVYTLASIESVKGNRERAESLKDELVRKYPHGKFAARPIMGKTTAVPMIKKSDANRNSDSTLPHNTIKVFIIIGLSTIVIGSVVIMGKMKGKIF